MCSLSAEMKTSSDQPRIILQIYQSNTANLFIEVTQSGIFGQSLDHS